MEKDHDNPSCTGLLARGGVAETDDRILIVDDNPIMREHLAGSLRDEGAEVVTAATGEQALLRLRDWSKPIGWLYAKAPLPGWVLADEYHDAYPRRSAVISAGERRPSSRDRIMENPAPAGILDALWEAIRSVRSLHAETIGEHRHAARDGSQGKRTSLTGRAGGEPVPEGGSMKGLSS
jgi:DNA-binding NarL/FixJ family response regulator